MFVRLCTTVVYRNCPHERQHLNLSLQIESTWFILHSWNCTVTLECIPVNAPHYNMHDCIVLVLVFLQSNNNPGHWPLEYTLIRGVPGGGWHTPFGKFVGKIVLLLATEMILIINYKNCIEMNKKSYVCHFLHASVFWSINFARLWLLGKPITRGRPWHRIHCTVVDDWMIVAQDPLQ